MVDEAEFNFARSLVNPEKSVRDETLQLVHSYISSVKSMDEMKMLKLWKALYYCLWLADKPDIQTELAMSLCNLMDHFRTVELNLMYIQMFYRTILREWCNLDQYRVNKFYLLIRLFLNKSFKVASAKLWSSDFTDKLLSVLKIEILTKRPNGIRFHLADIFLEELIGATGGNVEVTTFLSLCQIFIDSLTRQEDSVFYDRIVAGVFRKFIDQYAAQNKVEADLTQILFAPLCTLALQKAVFDTAAAESTPDFARKRLYSIHKEIATKSGVAFVSNEDLVSKSTLKRKSKEQTHVLPVQAAAAQEEAHPTSAKKVKVASDTGAAVGDVQPKASKVKSVSVSPVAAQTEDSSSKAEVTAPFVASSRFSGAKVGYVFHKVTVRFDSQVVGLVF